VDVLLWDCDWLCPMDQPFFKLPLLGRNIDHTYITLFFKEKYCENTYILSKIAMTPGTYPMSLASSARNLLLQKHSGQIFVLFARGVVKLRKYILRNIKRAPMYVPMYIYIETLFTFCDCFSTSYDW
jgi:hypothetical protein